MSNTWCLFVDVEMSFKIWDTIYPLVNTCKQMNIQICMCPVIIPGGCLFVLLFVPFAVGRSWMPDKQGSVGFKWGLLSEGGGVVSEHRNFYDHCATNYLFFVVAFSSILLTGLPHPPTHGCWTPSVDLWTLTWWFVICAVVIYPSYFWIFIFSPQVTFVANVNRIPQNLLLVVVIDFLYLPLLISTYIHMYMYVLEH